MTGDKGDSADTLELRVEILSLNAPKVEFNANLEVKQHSSDVDVFRDDESLKCNAAALVYLLATRETGIHVFNHARARGRKKER